MNDGTFQEMAENIKIQEVINMTPQNIGFTLENRGASIPNFQNNNFNFNKPNSTSSKKRKHPPLEDGNQIVDQIFMPPPVNQFPNASQINQINSSKTLKSDGNFQDFNMSQNSGDN